MISSECSSSPRKENPVAIQQDAPEYIATRAMHPCFTFLFLWRQIPSMRSH